MQLLRPSSTTLNSLDHYVITTSSMPYTNHQHLIVDLPMVAPVPLRVPTALVRILTAARVGVTLAKNASVKPTVARASILVVLRISAARISVVVTGSVHVLPKVGVVPWVGGTAAMV